MDNVKAQKLSYIVNTVLLLMVLGLWAFFYMCKARFLVYFSIPTTCVYLVNYILIKTRKLDIFVWLTYFWIVLYMGVTTVCLGFNMGFHLYSMSLILVLFCTDYMAYKLKASPTRVLLISIGIALVYICSTTVAIWNGPIYETEKIYNIVMLVSNAITVFSFIIIYTKILLNMVISSEKQLLHMALYDNLTGLYNRHYMMDSLKEQSNYANSWIAIMDIDNFKKINDVYGHNAGDYVLNELAKILTTVGEGCTIARWGGEEFLILGSDMSEDISVLEQLRNKVAEKPIVFEESPIAVTVTIGVSVYNNFVSVDKWIQDADQKLYFGKNNGKNRVVYSVD